jgi:SAM-dependent methyltransferase
MTEEIKQDNSSYKDDQEERSFSKKPKTDKDLKRHWDTAYEKSSIPNLGWYEEYPDVSLRLIEKCKLQKEASILNVGAGATTLIDELLKLGYENIIANDISPKAINKLKKRLGDQNHKVNWIIDDLTQPTELARIGAVGLWHDRAVLHFFINEKDQNTYFKLLKRLVKSKGFVIITTFNLNGAEKCSGLPVHRYDENMLQSKLGDDFELIESFDYTYKMPSEDTREYVYTLFQRK